MPSVLITGTNRGIGLELARQYADAGWQVFACMRDPKKARILRMMEKEIEILPLDVAGDKSIASLAKSLKGKAIDIVINNAGIFGGGQQSFGKTSTKNWLSAFHVNCIGPLHVLEALTPNLAKGKLKIAATISSLMGSVTDLQSAGNYIYRTSKSAVNMAMAIAAIDLKEQGITTVILNPGWVQTDMGGDSAPLTVEESVKGLRKVLAKVKPSDSGKFINFDGKKLPW